MAESYGEAIKCLKDRYDCPRVIDLEHVQSILQAPIMKGNNGRELWELLNIYKQHIRDTELFGSFWFGYVPEHRNGIKPGCGDKAEMDRVEQ